MKWIVGIGAAILAFGLGVFLAPTLRSGLIDLTDMPADIRDKYRSPDYVAKQVQTYRERETALEESRAALKARAIANISDDLPPFPLGTLMHPLESAKWIDAKLTGDTGAFYESDGTWRIVNMWASWCAPCLAELPDIEWANSQLGDEFEVFAVNIDTLKKDTPSDVLDIFRKVGVETLDPIIALDHNRDAWLDAMGGSHYPANLIFNPQNEPVAMFYGAPTGENGTRWAEEETVAFFRALAERGRLD